ncbi:MAG: IS200/IS605 family transposase [Chloroflexota bacterium]
MPYWRTFYHIVWSTQERQPQIDAALEAERFACLSSTAQRLGATVHAINGTGDHVHLVLSVPPTVALATIGGQVKGSSAHLANHRPGADGAFSWERGYGLFTLGPRQLPRAVAYVRGQKEHHAQRTTIASLERSEA